MGLFREFGNPLAALQQNRRRQAEILKEGLAAVGNRDESGAVRSLAELHGRRQKHLGERIIGAAAINGIPELIDPVSMATGVSSRQRLRSHLASLYVQEQAEQDPTRKAELIAKIDRLSDILSKKKKKRRL